MAGVHLLPAAKGQTHNLPGLETSSRGWKGPDREPCNGTGSKTITPTFYLTQDGLAQLQQPHRVDLGFDTTLGISLWNATHLHPCSSSFTDTNSSFTLKSLQRQWLLQQHVISISQQCTHQGMEHRKDSKLCQRENRKVCSKTGPKSHEHENLTYLVLSYVAGPSK